MKLFLLLPILISLTKIHCVPKLKSYEGYKVMRIQPNGQHQVDTILKFIDDDNDFDVWNLAKPNLATTDIMVSPERTVQFSQFLDREKISYDVMFSNVEPILRNEYTRISSKREQSTKMTWEEFNDIDTIYKWINNLAATFPNLVTVIKFGKSYEMQDMLMLKVSNGKTSAGDNKPAFLLDAGIHAREWISPATATYILNELITRSDRYTDILNAYDFYFVPLLNPDGYRYTFDEDRLWRKSRSETDSYYECIGVDMNRNCDYKWKSCSGCSSGNPCSQVYRGPTPFSESEVDSLRAFIENSSEINWRYYISLHCYSQMMLTPWGFTEDFPANYIQMKTAADYFAGNVSRLYGTEYITGNSYDVIYPTDGTTQDWAISMGFKYSYTIELRDTGNYGFVLPPEQIIPTGEETWAGILAMAKHFIATDFQ